MFNVVDHFMETFQPSLLVHLCIGCSVLPLNFATRSHKTKCGRGCGRGWSRPADLAARREPWSLPLQGSSVRMLIFVDIASEDHGASVPEASG